MHTMVNTMLRDANRVEFTVKRQRVAVILKIFFVNHLQQIIHYSMSALANHSVEQDKNDELTLTPLVTVVFREEKKRFESADFFSTENDDIIMEQVTCPINENDQKELLLDILFNAFLIFKEKAESPEPIYPSLVKLEKSMEYIHGVSLEIKREMGKRKHKVFAGP